MNIKRIVAGTFAIAAVAGIAACSTDSNDASTPAPNTPVADTQIHFQVNSTTADGSPANTKVFYTEDGKTNIDVGEVGDFWEVTIPFNRFASVTFTTGAGTLAECHTHEYNKEVDFKVVGENSWENCSAK